MGIAICLICILVVYDIVTRTLFAMSTSWVMEVSDYLMAYIAFGGAAYALKEGAHVKVDLVVDLLPSAAQRALGFVTDTVMLVVAVMLAWLSFEFWRDAWTSDERSESLLNIPLWIPYLVFLLGMVWLLIEVLIHLLARGKHRKSDQGQGDG